eukprot:131758_1
MNLLCRFETEQPSNRFCLLIPISYLFQFLFSFMIQQYFSIFNCIILCDYLLNTQSTEVVLPAKRQRLSNKPKSWFLPVHIERAVLLLDIKIPLSRLYDETTKIDEWRFDMDEISKPEYNKIAAPKPTTARNHVLQLAHHVKYGHDKYLQAKDIQKAYITDKGSLKCRGNESIRTNCHTYTINTDIPPQFTKENITQFSCLYKGTINKVQQDSDDAKGEHKHQHKHIIGKKEIKEKELK